MGRIKSALELALERTEGVKGDKASIGQFEAKQRGKKAANAFLAGEGEPMEASLKKCPRDEAESFRQGIYEVLLAQIGLPQSKDDMPRLERLGKGLCALIPDKRMALLFQQFSRALEQYLGEASQFEEMVKRQYAPKLRQKEEELSRRYGREVKLDPFQDPEFIAFYNQNMNALRDNYQGMADQVRQQVEALKQ